MDGCLESDFEVLTLNLDMECSYFFIQTNAIEGSFSDRVFEVVNEFFNYRNLKAKKVLLNAFPSHRYNMICNQYSYN